MTYRLTSTMSILSLLSLLGTAIGPHVPASCAQPFKPGDVLTAAALNAAIANGIVLIDDTLGFPVTIDQPGSYRLTSNLTVTDPNVNAIEIVADNVTLDLNGFAILGPGGGQGNGVKGTSSSITVVNGSVEQMGGSGITLRGTNLRVERIHAAINGNAGIEAVAPTVNTPGACLILKNTSVANKGPGVIAGAGCKVESNAVTNNGGDGIAATNGNNLILENTVSENTGFGIRTVIAVVRNNTVAGNNRAGIVAQRGSVVTGNAVFANTEAGLLADASVGYAENVFNGNRPATTGGGTQLGRNICDGKLCP